VDTLGYIFVIDIIDLSLTTLI